METRQTPQNLPQIKRFSASEVPGDLLRTIFGNLTEPFGDFYVLGLPKASY